MTQIVGAPKYIQEEEIAFRSPISESTMYKYGQTNNYLLDHYPIAPGTVHAFAGPEANVPSGYIPCDGRSILKTAEPDLYAAIAGYWGETLTHFNVPDMRGLFLRMVDTTTNGDANRDPDELTRAPSGTGTASEPGSYQADEFKAHTHNWFNQGGAGGDSYANTNSGQANPLATSSTGGAESRPKNVYVIYMIKT
jgi:microcystin-dependent protein